MGTRGAYGFRIDGEDKVSYNHWDSYPTGLGAGIADYISTHTVPDMIEVAERLVLVNESDIPTEDQIERWQEFHDDRVSSGSVDEFYSLMRASQGDLSVYDNEGLVEMIDGQDFMADSLFCEYAYIINLDTENLEFYRGFNMDAEAAGRYAALDAYASENRQNYYRGVKLMAEFPLSGFDRNEVVAEMDRLVEVDSEED
jgi:hypothetical protein